MMSHRSILLPLLLLSVSCCCCGQDTAPPLVQVNLDSDPRVRWETAMTLFDPAYLRHCAQIIIRQLAPEWVHAIVRRIADELERFIHKDYAEEIRGIAAAIGISVGDGFLLNLSYESSTFCTSIVVQDLNGTIYHSRNMDFGFDECLKNLTIDVEFVKNKEVHYKGTTFFGYVGIWTGQSPYKFTISGNQRTGEGNWWENAIAAILKRGNLVSWLIRDTLNEADDFESAVLKLAKTPLIADVYYIVGGVMPKEGVVITRDRSKPVDIWPLDPLNKQWFLVETNYDHWTTPPPYDHRRTAAIMALNATGQKNINYSTLLKVMSVNPVLNKNTIYTTLMCARSPEQYSTWIRRNPE